MANDEGNDDKKGDEPGSNQEARVALMYRVRHRAAEMIQHGVRATGDAELDVMAFGYLGMALGLSIGKSDDEVIHLMSAGTAVATLDNPSLQKFKAAMISRLKTAINN